MLLDLIAQSEKVGGQHHRNDHDGQQHMGYEDEEVDHTDGAFFAKGGAFRGDVVAHVTQQKQGAQRQRCGVEALVQHQFFVM